jgi:hypothetical protein
MWVPQGGTENGFPRVRAMVSLVSPELPVACPCLKVPQKLSDAGSSKKLKLVILPSPIPELRHAPLPPLVLRAGSMPRVPHNSIV